LDILTDKQMLYLYLDLRDNETANTLPATTTMKRNIRDVYSLRPDPSLTAVQNAAGYINGVYRDYIYDSSYLLTLDLFSQFRA
jgi:hypothetical protein